MIVVVGGGLTGLALGHEIRGRGARHTVLEAEDRAGGVIRSGRVDGHLLEWGPQRTRRTAAVREMIEELRLEREVVTAPEALPLFVYSRGKLRRVPFSPGQLLRTDLLSARGKARLLLEPLTAGAKPGETVASYLSRKLGREAYERLVAPLYGGLYASDPADMIVDLSLSHVLREFGVGSSLLLPLVRGRGRISPPAAISFRDGMQTLTEALLRENRENVRLGTAARAIRTNGAGFVVETEEEAIDAEHVVLTAPAPAAARLLEPLSADAARRVESLNYNPLAVVHLYAETDLRGLGYQVSFGESLATRGVTFNDSLFGRAGVYTAYLGGARSAGVVERHDADLGRLAADEFRLVTGFGAEPLSVARARMPAWDRSWSALQGLVLPDGIHLAANWQSRPGIPGRLAQAKELAAKLSE